MFFKRTNVSSSKVSKIDYDPVLHLKPFSSEDVWNVDSLNLTVEVLMQHFLVLYSRRL